MRAFPRSGRSRPDPWKAAFFGLAAIALVAGVTWALLGSSLFVVRSVHVSGSRQVSKADVIAAAGIRLGTPLIRIDTQAVARKVERLTRVQSATVARSWPDTIVISVIARTAVLAVATRGGYDRMDAFGVVLGWQPGRPAGLPVLLAPAGPVAALRGNQEVFAAGTIVRHLPGQLRSMVTAVRAAAPGAVTLLLRGGVKVLWGGPGRATAKASELVILLRTQARYYDVSDPGTAVTSG